MNRKELGKTFVMVSNGNPLSAPWFIGKYFNASKVNPCAAKAVHNYICVFKQVSEKNKM